MSAESNSPYLSTDDLVQTGKSGYLTNLEALEYLKEKRDFWYDFSILSMAATSVAVLFSLGLASGVAAAALKTLATVASFDRLILIIELLLEAFKNEITIIPKVKTDAGKIELFVKTNDGRLFAFESRSKGTSQIKWRQEHQDFLILSSQKNGKTRTQKWAELSTIGANLNTSVLALKKQKNEIVGKTNTQLRKPVTRAIILTGKTEIDPNNDEALFADFGKLKKEDRKLLRVAAENTVFLLNQDDLVNFLLPKDKNL